MTLQQAWKKFPNEGACLEHLERARWGRTPRCPYCKSAKTTQLRKEHRYHCNSCDTSFSITVGTIFHKTHLDLQVWFTAISILKQSESRISARQLGEALHVNKNTAWRMLKRIHQAMIEQPQLIGEI